MPLRARHIIGRSYHDSVTTLNCHGPLTERGRQKRGSLATISFSDFTVVVILSQYDDRERERLAHRETGTQADRQAGRQTETDTQRHRQTYRQTDTHTHKKTDMHRQAHRHAQTYIIQIHRQKSTYSIIMTYERC